MTDAAMLFPAPAKNPFAADPAYAATGLLLALSLAPTLAAMALDSRFFQGESIWLKPVKFQLSLAMYALSLAVFARWLPRGINRRRDYRAFRAVVIGCIVVEMIWISGAAMLGTASHYNQATPLMAALYPLMGVAAVTLTSASLVMGIAIWRNRDTGLSPALHLAVALGLVLTFALTVPVAGTLSGLPDGHFIGTPVTGAAVPILGWSREVGDLRAAHFLATHAMHALPLAGLALAALLPRRLARPAVWGAAALFVTAVGTAFALALAGRPLLPV